MSDPQNHTDDTPEVEAQGIDPDMPSTDDGLDQKNAEDDDDFDLEDLP